MTIIYCDICNQEMSRNNKYSVFIQNADSMKRQFTKDWTDVCPSCAEKIGNIIGRAEFVDWSKVDCNTQN